MDNLCGGFVDKRTTVQVGRRKEREFFKGAEGTGRAGQKENGKATVIPKAIHKVEKKFHPSTFNYRERISPAGILEKK